MTTLAEQLQEESRLRFRWGVVSFAAALLLVVSQLLVLSAKQPPVSESTVSIIAYDSSAGKELISSILDLLALGALAALLFWLHRSAQARQPQLRTLTRLAVATGAVLAGVMAMVSTVLLVQKAHTFVTTGDQSYPEAHRLFSTTALLAPQLLAELGSLLLAVGVIIASLSAMRVGLFPRIVGYAGVVAGALFIIPVPALTPVIQGFWLAATAVLLARRWPSGDPPAWDAGVAVPWQPLQPANQPDNRGTRAQRRARVSDKDVLAAVEKRDAPPNPKAGRSKRKKRR
jgi:hypothetical protein